MKARARVEMYESVPSSRGMVSVDDYVAHLPGVRAELEAEARATAPKAEMNLLQHRTSGDRTGPGGHARIEVEEADLDWHVCLVDDDGNAMTIEVGRAPAIYVDENDRVVATDDGSQGIFVLHDAFGLRDRTKRGQPRRRRVSKNYRRRG